jgi:hypothetical protein
LKLRLPSELREQSWTISQQLRKGFIAEVVERIAERLHAHFGSDALIEIPLLEVKWDGNEHVITDFDYARKLGDEFAEEVLSEFDSQNIEHIDRASNTAGKIRVYRSQAHKSAVIISALARQQLHSASIANLTVLEQEWQSLCEQGTDHVVDGVRYICDLDAADAVIESLNIMLIQTAVAVCPLSRWPEPIREITATRLLQSASEHTNDAKGSGLEPQSERSVTRSETKGKQHFADNDVTSSLSEKKLTEHTGERDAEPEESNKLIAATGDTSDTQGDEASQPDRHKITSDDNIPKTEHIERTDKNDVSDNTTLTESNPAEMTDEQYCDDSVAETIIPPHINEQPGQQTTHYAGLVYMLNLVMRIELAEILWCCGIDEGSFLFDLCRQLADDDAEHDPILAAITGIEADCSNYKPVAVSNWAWCEIVQKVHTHLQGLLPRKSHYVYSDEDIELLSKSSCDEEASWQYLVEVIACLLAAAFLDLVRADDAQAIGPYLCQEGWLEVTEDEAIVGLPMESIDIDVRRAALDVNPGYLQWCCLKVQLVFVESAAL